MTKPKTALAYIELPAFDFDAAEQFYSSLFSWEFISYGEEYLAFKSGLCEGGFYKSTLVSSSKQGAALPILQTDTLDALALEVSQSAGAVTKSIFYFPGGRRFHFTDPHGNELAVWSPKDRDGSMIE